MADDKNRWTGRPWLAIAIRVAIVAVPLLIGLAVSELGIRLLRAQIARTRWWLVLVLAISILTCIGVERLTRRLLPLSTLFKLSMLFPDRAPSRFKVARGAAGAHRKLAAHAAGNSTSNASQVAESLLGLITSLGLHDRRTRGHSERVCIFVELLADQLRVSREDRDRLRWAALLHNVGKLRVAASILNKPAKLSDSEWALVAEHPANGEEILGPLMDWLGEWGLAVRHHHERYDGSGYPDGIGGGEIPKAGRIVAIADSFEVMTAHRAYKKPMATVAARAELARCAGSQFDPAYVRAFLGISLPRLLWAMGPGARAMNLPMIRVLVSATPRALAAIPQGAAAAVVVGGSGRRPAPRCAQGSGYRRSARRCDDRRSRGDNGCTRGHDGRSRRPVSRRRGTDTELAEFAAARVRPLLGQPVGTGQRHHRLAPLLPGWRPGDDLSVDDDEPDRPGRRNSHGHRFGRRYPRHGQRAAEDHVHHRGRGPDLAWRPAADLDPGERTDLPIQHRWNPLATDDDPEHAQPAGLLTGQIFFLRGTDAPGNHTNITSGVVSLLH